MVIFAKKVGGDSANCSRGDWGDVTAQLAYWRHSLGEWDDLVYVPCGPIIRLESRPKRLQPFIHPVDIARSLFPGDDTPDDSIL